MANQLHPEFGRGRPKGKKNKKTILDEVLRTKSEELMLKHLKRVVETVIDRANQGDMTAAKMILDRVIPIKKAVDVTTHNKGGSGINIIIGSLEKPAIEGQVITQLIQQEINDAEDDPES
jgi:hypothetical protein